MWLTYICDEVVTEIRRNTPPALTLHSSVDTRCVRIARNVAGGRILVKVSAMLDLDCTYSKVRVPEAT